MSSVIAGSPVRSGCSAPAVSLEAERQPLRVRQGVRHADGGDRGQALAGRVELEHAADVGAQRRGRDAHRLGQHRVEIVALQREAAERRDRALLAGASRARCCAARVRSLMSRATTSRDSIVPSSARTGTAWTAKVTPPLENSKLRRSPRSPAR